MTRLLRVATIMILSVTMFIGTAQAETVLKMAGWGGTPDIEGFQKLHPDVKIEYQQVPGSYAFIEKAIVWAASGSLPDIVLIPYWGLPGFADNSVLMDLSKFVAKEQRWVQDFFPGSVDAFKRNGRVFGLPWLVGPMSIVYNPAIFAQGGLLSPMQQAKNGTWTMDSLVQQARKLTKKTADNRLDMVGMISRTDQLAYIAPLLWGYGGDIVSEDGRTVLLNQAKSLTALEKVAALYSTERVFVSNAQAKEYNIDFTQTMNGPNTAMRLVWNVQYGTINSAGIPVDIAPTPIDMYGKGTNLINTHGIGISSQTKNADLAWEYIKYALGLVPTNLEFPSRQEHFRPWAEDMQSRLGWKAFDYIQLVADSVRLNPRPMNQTLETLYNRYLGRALVGTMPPKEAAAELERLVAGELAKLK